MDQLPPFNLTLLFSNEQGYASYQRLLGMVFVDDGTVYSIHDQFTERSLVYLAEDFTELTPLTLSSLYQPKDVGVSSAASLCSISTGCGSLIPGFFPRAELNQPRASGADRHRRQGLGTPAETHGYHQRSRIPAEDMVPSSGTCHVLGLFSGLG